MLLFPFSQAIIFLQRYKKKSNLIFFSLKKRPLLRLLIMQTMSELGRFVGERRGVGVGFDLWAPGCVDVCF